MGMLYYAQAPVVPRTPPVELNHAYNFQEFDGLMPLDNAPGAVPAGTNYGSTPRPGALNTPLAEQTYTQGPLSATVGTLGGQPLPVANPLYRLGRGYTPSTTPTIQFRIGAGQNYQGAAQTVALSEVTNNPPVPGDLSGIIAGWA
jgi:hypothetical protein